MPYLDGEASPDGIAKTEKVVKLKTLFMRQKLA
jgi:hypothetical protein